MTGRAAHLVDHVFPEVPVRQWVLTLPPALRYRLAWNHDLCRAVVAVFVRAVVGWLRREARRRGVVDGRGGAVVIVQRFGSALNLNVHLHAMVMDGVFVSDREGREGEVRFVAARHPRVPRGGRLWCRRSVTPQAELMERSFGVDVLAFALSRAVDAGGADSGFGRHRADPPASRLAGFGPIPAARA